MIDIDNYKRAIAWMRRNLTALQQSSDDKFVQYAVLQSFEVTFNITEEVLRRAYAALGTDEAATYLSFREVVYRANHEGLGFISNMHWLQYGLALESIRQAFLRTADLEIDIELSSLLQRYIEELERFSNAFERELVAGA